MIAGFTLGSHGHFYVPLFFQTLLGLSSLIASACVFNNYIDRDRDQKMERTKNRPLAQGLISHTHALLFASLLGILGMTMLLFCTNLQAAAIGAVGFFVYVALYSFRKLSPYATGIGSIAGATPPVVGYVAADGSIDLCAALLFSILVLWQMPHFYAIAMYRLNDYQAAELPVLPITKGPYTTKVHMLLYVIAFCFACLLLSLLGYAGYGYLIITALVGGAWLLLSLQGFRASNDARWARKMFIVSLVVITTLSFTITLM